MFCFSCGKQIRDDAKFCPFCGEDTAEPEEAGDVSQGDGGGAGFAAAAGKTGDDETAGDAGVIVVSWDDDKAGDAGSAGDDETAGDAGGSGDAETAGGAGVFVVSWDDDKAGDMGDTGLAGDAGIAGETADAGIAGDGEKAGGAGKAGDDVSAGGGDAPGFERPPAFGSAEVAEKRADAEARRKAEQKRRGKRAAAAIVVFIIICALAFVFYIAPKFMGMQIVPFDPFGIAGSGGVGGGSESPDGGGNDGGPVDGGVGNDNGDNGNGAIDDGGTENIDVVNPDGAPGLAEVQGVTISAESIEPGDDGAYVVQQGSQYHLKATVSPEEAQGYAKVEWFIQDGSQYAVLHPDGVFDALEPGYAVVGVRAYAEEGMGAETTVTFIIEGPGQEGSQWPSQGTLLVTSEPKLGIFIRSEPVAKGSGNSMNDGNKIGWIAGGDESVILVATGNGVEKGGYSWYEVEIPESYRETEEQQRYYKDKPLTGWVRYDLVKKKQ